MAAPQAAAAAAPPPVHEAADEPAPAPAPTAPAALLPPETAAQISARLGESMGGAINCLCIFLGHELGLYSSLSRLGAPATPAQLAEAAGGLSERWVREWCLQAAAARLVCCDAAAARFWMTPDQAAVLVEPAAYEAARESPLEMAIKMPVVLGNARALQRAFRTGVGLSFDDCGIDHCHMHRHARAVQLLERMQRLPGLVARLEQGVRVADVGCGSGETMLFLAGRFPASSFTGYDISRRALAAAEAHKARLGVANVAFLNPGDGPASRLPGTPTFHLIVVQDAIHDMTDPDAMLRVIRQSLLDAPQPPPHCSNTSSSSSSSTPAAAADALEGYDGQPCFLVTDIKSAGSPAANLASLPGAAFLYGVSLGICMSSSTSEPGGAGLGTLGWPEALAREMGVAAGFSRFAVLEGGSQDAQAQWHAHYMMRA